MGDLLNHLSKTDPQFRKARLGALYSDFTSLAATNPDGYTANVSAWQRALSSAALSGSIENRHGPPSIFTLDVNDGLLKSLESKECGRPLALNAVFREALRKKDFVALGDYEKGVDDIYAKSGGWGIPSTKQVVTWLAAQVGLVGSADRLPVGAVVIVRNLEEVAQVFRAKYTDTFISRTDRVVSEKQFGKMCTGLVDGLEENMSDEDREVFLRFLSRYTHVLAWDCQSHTIKFKDSTERRSEITEEDRTIAELKDLMAGMELQIDTLSKRVETLGSTARDHVARKNRVAALGALRSKKLAEANLSRQTATMAQLEEVFTKIGQAADQVELVKIMEGSTGVLKKLNAEVGGVERVDNIVDELKEQMTQVDEINNAIAEVGQSGAVDEGEVDEELEAMEEEARKQSEEAEKKKREAREEKEATETKKRLDALDVLEKEMANPKHTEMAEKNEPVKKRTEELKRLSLEPAT